MKNHRITITTPDFEIHVDPRPVGDPRIHGRAHLWNVPATGTPMQSRRLALRTVFMSVLDKSPTRIAGWHDEHGHAYEDSRSVVDNLLRQAAWRQTAGCSCGCSPGFILRDFPYDVYATFKPAAK